MRLVMASKVMHLCARDNKLIPRSALLACCHLGQMSAKCRSFCSIYNRDVKLINVRVQSRRSVVTAQAFFVLGMSHIEIAATLLHSIVIRLVSEQFCCFVELCDNHCIQCHHYHHYYHPHLTSQRARFAPSSTNLRSGRRGHTSIDLPFSPIDARLAIESTVPAFLTSILQERAPTKWA